MIQLPPIHQYDSTESVGGAALFKFPDGTNIALFRLGDEGQVFLRVLSAGAYCSYFVGMRDEMVDGLAEDFLGRGSPELEYAASESWLRAEGFTAALEACVKE